MKLQGFEVIVLAILLAAVISALFGITKRGKAQKVSHAKRVELCAAGDVKARRSRRFRYMGVVGASLAGVGWLVASAYNGISPIWISLAGFLVGAIASLISSAIGDLAENKGRSFMAFFWLTMLFSPLITWLIAATLAPLDRPSSNRGESPSAGSDISSQIGKLNELRLQGALTDAEYDAKKKDLLDRI